jgi:CBS domain containing-hemolysin-like protein
VPGARARRRRRAEGCPEGRLGNDRKVLTIEVALGLAAILVLSLGTGFYVAGEFALITVDRNRMEHLAVGGDARSQSVLSALKRLSFHLSGAQLGITVTSLLVGFIVEPTIGRAMAPLVAEVAPGASLEISTTLALVFATAVQMVLGELMPKNLAISRPESLALGIATPFRVANGLFGPIIEGLNAAANWTVRRLGIEPREELAGVRSVQELERLIYSSRQEGVLPEEEFSLLARSISFGDKTADDALVPRVSVVSVKVTDTLGDLVRIAVATGHSRFPVCGRDIDDVVGLALVKDSYRFPADQRSDIPVTEIMQEALFVPESRPLESLLAEMRRQRRHLAIVVDEFGGTSGVITLEDLLEEIVGEIDDEYDPDDTFQLTSPPEGIHVLSGMLHPDEVREACGFEMPAGDYETLAGFLLVLFDRIPSPGEHAAYAGWEFKITEMDGRRIAQVLGVAPSQRRENLPESP